MAQRKLEDQISAFVDDELPEQECELLVRRLMRDEDLRATLGRFALIGELMRGGYRRSADLERKVSEAVAGEGVHSAKRGARWSNRILRPVAGLAVAMSVAVLAIFSLLPGPATDQIAGNALEPAVVVPPTTKFRPVQPPARLTNYWVTHSDYTRTLSQLTDIVAAEEEEAEVEPE